MGQNTNMRKTYQNLCFFPFPEDKSHSFVVTGADRVNPMSGGQVRTGNNIADAAFCPNGHCEDKEAVVGNIVLFQVVNQLMSAGEKIFVHCCIKPENGRCFAHAFFWLTRLRVKWATFPKNPERNSPVQFRSIRKLQTSARDCCRVTYGRCRHVELGAIQYSRGWSWGYQGGGV